MSQARRHSQAGPRGRLPVDLLDLLVVGWGGPPIRLDPDDEFRVWFTTRQQQIDLYRKHKREVDAAAKRRKIARPAVLDVIEQEERRARGEPIYGK